MWAARALWAVRVALGRAGRALWLGHLQVGAWRVRPERNCGASRGVTATWRTHPTPTPAAAILVWGKPVRGEGGGGAVVGRLHGVLRPCGVATCMAVVVKKKEKNGFAPSAPFFCYSQR